MKMHISSCSHIVEMSCICQCSCHWFALCTRGYVPSPQESEPCKWNKVVVLPREALRGVCTVVLVSKTPSRKVLSEQGCPEASFAASTWFISHWPWEGLFQCGSLTVWCLLLEAGTARNCNPRPSCFIELIETFIFPQILFTFRVSVLHRPHKAFIQWGHVNKSLLSCCLHRELDLF